MTDESADGTQAQGATAGTADVPSDLPPAVRTVEQARLRLGLLDGQPVSGHIETYDGVHTVLQDALAELDEA